MSKEKGRKKERSSEKPEAADPKTDKQQEEPEEEFDFGGLPKNVPFKRNMGCGG